MPNSTGLVLEAARTTELESQLADTQEKIADLEKGHYVGKLEWDLAARVHESLLPKPVRHSRIDIDIRYVPVCGIGGDYCQVLFPDNFSCCISICDVTGHGLAPALLATRVSSEVRRLTFEGHRPREILFTLNKFLLRHFDDTDLQVTFFTSRIDLEQRTITYSGGGHPSPLLIRNGSEQIQMLASQNMLLGVREDCLGHEPEHTLGLSAGDRVLFFTDGLLETRTEDSRLLGEDGLIEIAKDLCVGSVFEVTDCILRRIAARRDGPAHDDMTLIAAEIK